MTVAADIASLAPAATTVTNGYVNAQDYNGLVELALTTAQDLKRMMNQIKAITPTGDAATVTKLNAIIAELV